MKWVDLMQSNEFAIEVSTRNGGSAKGRMTWTSVGFIHSFNNYLLTGWKLEMDKQQQALSLTVLWAAGEVGRWINRQLH